MSLSSQLPPSQEAYLRHMAEHDAEAPHSAWTGWITFAAAVLVLIGLMNMFRGLLALFDEGYFIADAKQLVLVNYDVWGVFLMLWGAFMVIVGGALSAGRGWARWTAGLVVMIDVIGQIGFLPAYPFASVVLIGLDVVVLYALTVRWDEAQRTY